MQRAGVKEEEEEKKSERFVSKAPPLSDRLFVQIIL
jgi:putative IMPACT (imprinted ancient) family translation regulator